MHISEPLRADDPPKDVKVTTKQPRVPTKSATIYDIARTAGVGKSTAARALSGRGYVSDDVLERVLRAAERVGYVPNLAARQLKSSQSGIVGVLLADLRNPFYAEVASGIEEVLAASEYYMVLATDNRNLKREELAVRTFTSMKAAGVILTPSQVRGQVASYLVARNVAVVEIDERTVDVSRSAAVLVDSVSGVGQGVKYLVENGHRRLAAVLWDVDRQAGSERRDGYVEGLRAAGITVDEGLVRSVPDGPEGARLATRDLLAKDDRFTAIVVTNELVCLGVMEAIWEAGLRVPQNLSVVGFDDAPWMRTTSPPITTVAQPTVEIGRRAARAMISLLEGSEPEFVVARLAPELIVRGSAGVAPRGECEGTEKANHNDYDRKMRGVHGPEGCSKRSTFPGRTREAGSGLRK